MLVKAGFNFLSVVYKFEVLSFWCLFLKHVESECSVIVEALKVDSLQKLCSSLEPILRRVVRQLSCFEVYKKKKRKKNIVLEVFFSSFVVGYEFLTVTLNRLVKKWSVLWRN